ncbi:MAG: hypothetical protein FJ143_12790, partial [Deltaproteobacteria bacterium]|nr:hypothetical protein [Deltaproteobacteria bacterium]
MEHTRENQPTENSHALITLTPARATRRWGARVGHWAGPITRRGMLALAALSLLALPVAVIIHNRHDLRGDMPLLERIISGPPAPPSAVLAVDSRGMTIDGKNISIAARKRLEQAAVEQLARLHHIYAGWVPTDEDAVGTMLLKLHVDGAGNVAKIEPLRSRLSSGDFARVVFEEMRQWSFPGPATQPFEITMPLLFVPKGLDAGTVVQWERRTGDRDAERKFVKIAQNLASTAAVPVKPGKHEVNNGGIQQAVQAPAKIAARAKPVLPVVKTTRSVALRQQPRFAAERLHEVDAETELNLIERKGDWMKVRLADARAVG